MSFAKYHKKATRLKDRYQAFHADRSQLDGLYRVCLDHISPVTEPLALISQIQRSGGSLLSQLFDGHPEIHAHPHELKIGYPKKYIWPQINLNEPAQRWFYILFEESVIRLSKQGYKKEPTSDITFPFIFLPALQKKIFLKYLDSLSAISLRDVFNAYMTSYFGAWLNNQNRDGSKKIVTAFTPRLAMSADNMDTYFKIYPDARLISVVRDPSNWYPSALRHNLKIKKDKYSDIEIALQQWKECTQSAIRNKERFGERVCIIKFEDLIGDPGAVMHCLAEFLEIEFDPVLLTPTFNKSPIRANTSFKEEKTGIVKSTLARHETLSAAEISMIVEMTQDVYRSALDEAVAF
jgi:hypothetical protein